jgi:hypothetical protein
LTGGSVVEHIAHQRRLSGFLDEIAETRSGGFKTLEEERIYRGKSRRELPRMQVPTLVVTVHERALHMLKVQPHGPMHYRAIFDHLFSGQ